MRTRRSPHNQEILWRALGDVKPEPKHEVCEVAIAEQILASPFSSPRDKAHAYRVLDREALRARVQRHLAQEIES